MHWRPHPDVLVRAKTNPDGILINATPGGEFIWWLLTDHEELRIAIYDPQDPLAPPTNVFGWAPDKNHHIARTKDVTKRAPSKSWIDMPVDQYANPPSSRYYYRKYEDFSKHPQQFAVNFLKIDTDEVDEVERLNLVLLGTDEVQISWTDNAGRDWRSYVSGSNTTVEYVGPDTDASGKPIGRYVLSSGGDLFFSRDDPLVFNQVTFPVRSNYQVTWLGGSTVEVIDNYFAHQILTQGASRSWRWVSHDRGASWSSEVGFPSSYNATTDAIFICTKLSDGTFLAIFPDAGGDVHCWTSANATSGWNKWSRLDGVNPEDNYPYWTKLVQLIPCENRDAFFIYMPDRQKVDPDDAYHQPQIWAIKWVVVDDDEVMTATKRPDVFGNGASQLDPYDEITQTGTWSTDYPFMNVHRLGPGVVTTVDNARLVMRGRNMSTLDPTEYFSTAGQFQFNPTYTEHMLYCDNGGSGQWNVGAGMSSDTRSSGHYITQHMYSRGSYFDDLLYNVGY